MLSSSSLLLRSILTKVSCRCEWKVPPPHLHDDRPQPSQEDCSYDHSRYGDTDGQHIGVEASKSDSNKTRRKGNKGNETNLLRPISSRLVLSYLVSCLHDLLSVSVRGQLTDWLPDRPIRQTDRKADRDPRVGWDKLVGRPARLSEIRDVREEGETNRERGVNGWEENVAGWRGVRDWERVGEGEGRKRWKDRQRKQKVCHADPHLIYIHTRSLYRFFFVVSYCIVRLSFISPTFFFFVV